MAMKDTNSKELLKQRMLVIAKKACNEKMVAGTSGNMSVYFPEEQRILITPSSYDYGMMETSDLVTIDLEGNVVEGFRKPSSEWRMHAEIYRSLPHVKAIVHTHSPYATSFAVLRKEIPVILIEMIPFLKGSVEVSPYALQGSADVGKNTIPILKKKNVCLLANHGTVAVGDTIEDAYLNSTYLEDAAKIYHMASVVGTPVEIDV